jgi:hypothetical protein
MNFFQVYQQYYNEIEKLINQYSFRSHKDIKKTKINIIQTIREIALEVEMELEDLKILIDFLISNDKSFFKEGDLWNHITQELINKKILNIEQFIKFFKLIKDEIPKGLNQSPNACCGKYELLFFLLNKDSIRPIKGDIELNGIKYEIKGNDIRVTNKNLSGKDYMKKMIELHEKFGINLKGRDGHIIQLYETEKPKFTYTYKNHFEKYIEKSKKFHLEWFLIMGFELSNNENEKIHENNEWNYQLVRKYIVIKFQKIMRKNEEYDRLVLCWDGTDIKIIKNNEHFEQQILNNEIGIGSDFFRTKQTNPIGWYIISKKDIKKKKKKDLKTVKQLKEECKKKGITGYSKFKRKELEDILKKNGKEYTHKMDILKLAAEYVEKNYNIYTT